MNPFREMVLLSNEEYTKMRRQILNQQSPALYRDLDEVKERYGSNLPADQRLKLEGEVLSQHIRRNNASSEPTLSITPTITQPAPTPFNDQIIISHLESFPTVNKRRALQIYQHLKAYKIQWNTMGQLLNENGDAIDRSNIIELIDYVTGIKRSNRKPAGFNVFVKLLAESHMPHIYYSTVGKKHMDEYKHSYVEDADETEGMQLFSKWTRLS